jgi:hypothetical protein
MEQFPVFFLCLFGLNPVKGWKTAGFNARGENIRPLTIGGKSRKLSMML